MKTKLKYLLGCGIFLVCVGIGYFLTKFFVKPQEPNLPEGTYQPLSEKLPNVPLPISDEEDSIISVDPQEFQPVEKPNEKVEVKKEEKRVEQMTSSEFQSLLLNQNDNSLLGGKHPKVAKTVTLSFEGLHEEERIPGDILAVREKIAFGKWNSAKVLRVGYDENGRINSAKVQPIY